LHPNVQRLLRPIAVANNRPDADEDFPDHMTRTRRDHAKLLTLMDSIALLHQHQRKIKRDMSAANVFNLGADIAAMGASLALIVPANVNVLTVTFGIISLVAVLLIPYSTYATAGGGFEC
jgi:hypothetical protein